MSKVSNALNMYFLLMNNGIVSGKELAEKLEVTPRMIAEYKNDLEMAGIYIGSKSGPGGGYYLEKGVTINTVFFDQREIDALLMAREQYKSQNQVYADDLDILTNKITSIDKEKNQHIFKLRPKAIEERIKEEELLEKIQKAFRENLEMNMQYWRIGDEKLQLTNRRIQPYTTFYYKASLYLAAYCLERNSFRYFKLSRIEKLNISMVKFKRDESFMLEDLLKQSFGIYSGDLIDIKLKIKYPMSVIVKEEIYIDNQETEDIDGGIIFKAKMAGLTEIETWILGMGECVEVLEPDFLRERIKDRLEEAMKVYE